MSPASSSPPRWIMVHVITKLELGGAQLATLHEVAHSRFPTEARYLVYGPGGMLDDSARRLANTQCIELPALGRRLSPLKDLGAIGELARILRRLKRAHPGAKLLVHTHSSKAGIIGRLAARLGRADCVVHSIHGFGHSHFGTGLTRRVLLAAERLAGRVTHGFTADSAANLREGERDRLLGCRPRKVVRCGIDLAEYREPQHSRAEMRRALGIPAEAPVVLTVACLKPQKDPLCWAEVVRHVAQERPDARFLYAGDGELRAPLEAFIRQHDLAAQARLLGWRDDVANLLHASDLFLLTSRWEGLPQVFPQAMAARLPIVATAVDGNPEAVRDGENGLLFEAGHAAGMAAGIVALLQDAARRQAMAAAGSRRAADFSCERMLADLDEFYRLLTSQ
jgi:glycosyltransferase involved in cell wall biosynthesis